MSIETIEATDNAELNDLYTRVLKGEVLSEADICRIYQFFREKFESLLHRDFSNEHHINLILNFCDFIIELYRKTGNINVIPEILKPVILDQFDLNYIRIHAEQIFLTIVFQTTQEYFDYEVGNEKVAIQYCYDKLREILSLEEKSIKKEKLKNLIIDLYLIFSSTIPLNSEILEKFLQNVKSDNPNIGFRNHDVYLGNAKIGPRILSKDKRELLLAIDKFAENFLSNSPNFAKLYMEFINIHPFTDFNGRIIQTLMLCLKLIQTNSLETNEIINWLEESNYFSKSHVEKLNQIVSKFEYFKIGSMLLLLMIRQNSLNSEITINGTVTRES
ncbi:MAG: hypothetical protein KatS3mg085_481 [Candidatus Dojkabacteria bacterium]|nr:MAG: hypothetical protein KatS3mg085_481 [Candidatus Dojkabacteria bacterium]